MEFCTVFDRSYAPKGFSLFESLRNHSRDFRLHALLLDNFDLPDEIKKDSRFCYSFIDDVFEFRLLKLLKQYRSYSEYCWSLAALTTWLITERLPKTPITYLDSDVFFFNDPQKMFDIIGDKEVAIVSHRFLEEDEARLSPNGNFNISIVYFSGKKKSLEILNRWTYQVLQKCKLEDGCGDQVYANEWPGLLGDKLCILPDGIGNGPWSARAYEVKTENGEVLIRRRNTQEFIPLIAYHAHEHWRGNRIRTGYQLNDQVIKNIYEPYEAVHSKWEGLIK